MGNKEQTHIRQLSQLPTESKDQRQRGHQKMKTHTIIKDGIPVGFFPEQKDRDLAFERFVVPISDNCMKGEVE